MLTALALAVWFALSPTLERNRMNDYKNDLLISIEQGEGTIIISEAFDVADVDFYVTEGEFPQDSEGSDHEEESTVDLSAVSSADITEPTDTVIAGIETLTIERIDAKLPVTDGVSNAQLQVAVGHVPQTPKIGAIGNAVIAGHRSYTYGRFFNRLDELTIGDIIQYQSIEGNLLIFTVVETLVVLPGDPAAIWPSAGDSNYIYSDGGRFLTLLTCTPITTASHRLIVRARLINYMEGYYVA